MKFVTLTNAKKMNKLLYLAPANQSGYNVCKFSTKDCRKGCLNSSGRAKIEYHYGTSIIQDARVKKTKLFHEDNKFFMEWMVAEMKSYQNKANMDGMHFSARLNGTSDIDWGNTLIEGKNLFQLFPDVQFYDYTKDYKKVLNNKAANYHLTYSYTGYNIKQSIELLSKGYNVAVVFDTKVNKELPTTFNGYEVIDGDLTDYRPNDKKGCVVGLRFKMIGNKSNAKEVINSKFVVNV